jgi:hypothetical protein
MMPHMLIRRLMIVVAIVALSQTPVEKVFANPGKYTAQLETECDAMLQSAVQRPYGWSWDPLTSNADASKPRAVSMEPQGSPSVGLILQLAGELLKRPTYLDAAEQAARGALASHDDGGRIAPVPIFGESITVNADPSPLPDRAATRAALALALTVIPNANAKDELTTSAASAAKWLARQQSASGAWPTIYADSPDAQNPPRLARMDNTDARDCTLTMLLAGDILHDKSFALSASRTVTALLQMRQVDHHNLWRIAYDEKLSPVTGKLQLPDNVDLLASQYAMQTLLADYLFTGERRIGMSLDDAIRETSGLRRPEGEWDRFPQNAPPATTRSGAGSLAGGTLQISDLIDTVRQLKVLGREKYLHMAERHFTLKQQFALAICGLDDSRLLIDLPVTTDESLDYIRRHEADWKTLEDPPPAELTARVHRLWLLLVRAKIEQM